MALPAPPAPPLRASGRGGDDDEGLVLEQVERGDWTALLSVWLWQTERTAGCHSHLGIDVPRKLVEWEGDTSTGALSWLRGEVRAAKLGGDTIGLCFTRFELDKSSLARALSGSHVMVVDALVVSPSFPSQLQLQAREGIRSSLLELAAFRRMRAEFCPRFLAPSA